MIDNQKSIGEKAGTHFNNGFNCAEAVAGAALEGLGEDTTGALAHATASGGGFRRTFEGQQPLSLLFVGDAVRGKQLQETINSSKLKCTLKTEMVFEFDKYDIFNPDIVILDRFPESNFAKSAFYHFRENRNRNNKKISFIALNARPGAMKFIHLNRLSFLKMIHRDSKPETLINEIKNLVRSNHGLHLGTI